ncbi:hypothetical protein [Spirosoma flavum]|uniref:Uncharacterized protein n=1 Tax=Spirosoma flavum TaxID=2048557 RepID=A0ABW6AE91_9BACT
MKSIVETIKYQDWAIKGQDWSISEWQIQFLFSDQQLQEVKKLSRVDNWYEDPIVADTYIDRLSTCFNSIKKFHTTFGSLPQIGDRLFDDDLGMIIQNRAIDGDVMTITFTLSI